MPPDVDRLRENAVVTVSLPASGSAFRVMDFRATVIALIESGAALHPIDTTLPPGRAENVFLSFVSAEGQLVGLKGTLISHDDGRGVRFEVQDGVHVRRSRYTRVDAELPVTLDGTEGTTVNVAPEGLLVNAPVTVELGQELDVTLTLPGKTPLPLRAKVVRHAGSLIALHFAGARREIRAAVAEFVVERRAAELQGTRA
jgi:hypothetical protein